MKFLSEKLLKRVAEEDLDALVSLDDHGLLIGPSETLNDYCKRLHILKEKLAELVKVKDKTTLYDMTLIQDDKIPLSVFKECESLTEKLYRFKNDWVAGYFTNETMGLLFAGGAIYSFDEFFPLFIIRKAYKKKKKWFIYSRIELMAHELTHIAHVAYKTENYEELFAYQTSTSAFRRLIGGMFRTPKDSYLMLGSAFFASISQIINTLVREPDQYWDFPMPLIFGIAAFALAWLIQNYLRTVGVFKAAGKRISRKFGEENRLAILFRCTEVEIATISKMDALAFDQFLKDKSEKSLRWRVTLKKFSKEQ